ncbi:MAG: hypothetical protein UHD09_08295 [Bifidobacterium sp.]|nr:hypothetical protein [Bifidobacterium sp.]
MIITNNTATTPNIDELVEQATAWRFNELDWADQWETSRADAIRSAEQDMKEGKEDTPYTQYYGACADLAFENMQTCAREAERLIDQAAGNPFHTPDWKQRRADIALRVNLAATLRRFNRSIDSDVEEAQVDSRETGTPDTAPRRDLVDLLFNRALSWLTDTDGDDLTITADRANGFIYTGEVGIDLNAIAELLTKKGA